MWCQSAQLESWGKTKKKWCSTLPDSSCLVLEVLLPSLLMMVMETERGWRVRSMKLVVRVCAGREAAWAGRSGPRVRNGAWPWSRAWFLEDLALLMSTWATQGGVEVTVLAAMLQGLNRRRGGGWREGGEKVAFGQPLGVCNGCRGSSKRRWGKIPQGAILFDFTTILVLAWSVCPLYNIWPLLLLRNITHCILPHDIFMSISWKAVSARGCCERVLAVADWCASVSTGAKMTLPYTVQCWRVTTCHIQGHDPLPAGLARTLSLLWNTRNNIHKKNSDSI